MSPHILKVSQAPAPVLEVGLCFFDIHLLQNEVGSVTCGLWTARLVDLWNHCDTCMPRRYAPVTVSMRVMPAGYGQSCGPTRAHEPGGFGETAALGLVPLRGGHVT